MLYVAWCNFFHDRGLCYNIICGQVGFATIILGIDTLFREEEVRCNLRVSLNQANFCIRVLDQETILCILRVESFKPNCGTGGRLRCCNGWGSHQGH